MATRLSLYKTSYCIRVLQYISFIYLYIIENTFLCPKLFKLLLVILFKSFPLKSASLMQALKVKEGRQQGLYCVVNFAINVKTALII